MSRTITSNAITAVPISRRGPRASTAPTARRSKGVMGGESTFPPNPSVGRQERLYATDTVNFRVQVFDRAGTPLKSIGAPGDGPARAEAYRSSNT